MSADLLVRSGEARAKVNPISYESNNSSSGQGWRLHPLPLPPREGVLPVDFSPVVK